MIDKNTKDDEEDLADTLDSSKKWAKKPRPVTSAFSAVVAPAGAPSSAAATAALGNSSGAVSRKRGRPPKVISIKQKQEQQLAEKSPALATSSKKQRLSAHDGKRSKDDVGNQIKQEDGQQPQEGNEQKPEEHDQQQQPQESDDFSPSGAVGGLLLLTAQTAPSASAPATKRVPSSATSDTSSHAPPAGQEPTPQDPEAPRAQPQPQVAQQQPPRPPPRNIDWDALLDGGLRRLSPNERADLWRYMLESRPSPASSPPGEAGGAGDPRALSEWLDRILWISDPENWSSQPVPAVAAPGGSLEIEEVAPSEGEVHEVLEEDIEPDAVEEKTGDEDRAVAEEEKQEGEQVTNDKVSKGSE